MAVELVDCLAILVAVYRFHGMGSTNSRFLLRSSTCVHMKELVRRSTTTPFLRFLGNVRREFMQRPSLLLHGMLGSYLRDALHEVNFLLYTRYCRPGKVLVNYRFFHKCKAYASCHCRPHGSDGTPTHPGLSTSNTARRLLLQLLPSFERFPCSSSLRPSSPDLQPPSIASSHNVSSPPQSAPGHHLTS
jgi:hypothetical protein